MNNLFLPDGYVHRSDPKPYDDNGTTGEWQVGAYGAAWDLFMKGGFACVVDVGCGSGKQLRRFADLGMAAIGIDANPPSVPAANPRMQYVIRDLERPPVLWQFPRRTLVLCCDVVEHLRTPGHLLRALAHEIDAGSAVVISTPDRDLAGCAPLGPPTNPSHVREWNMAEFQQLCDFYGLVGGKWSHTQTVDSSPNCHTITGVFA